MRDSRTYEPRLLCGDTTSTYEARRTRRSSTEVIDRWLALQDEDREWPDADAESLLYRIADLLDADAPDSEVAAAVERAHLAGWDWAPIAILLGRDAGDVRGRFGGGPPPRIRRRFRVVRGWHPPTPRDSCD